MGACLRLQIPVAKPPNKVEKQGSADKPLFKKFPIVTCICPILIAGHRYIHRGSGCPYRASCIGRKSWRSSSHPASMSRCEDDESRPLSQGGVAGDRGTRQGQASKDPTPLHPIRQFLTCTCPILIAGRSCTHLE